MRLLIYEPSFRRLEAEITALGPAVEPLVMSAAGEVNLRGAPVAIVDQREDAPADRHPRLTLVPGLLPGLTITRPTRRTARPRCVATGATRRGGERRPDRDPRRPGRGHPDDPRDLDPRRGAAGARPRQGRRDPPARPGRPLPAATLARAGLASERTPPRPPGRARRGAHGCLDGAKVEAVLGRALPTVTDGIARLVANTCQGCGLAQVTLKQGIERRIMMAVPEVTGIHAL